MRTLMRVLLLLVAGAANEAIAEVRGTIGFTVNLEHSGAFWNPQIVALHVAKVAEGSPAAQAGLEAGDQIIAVQGVPVAGAEARKIADMVHVPPHEHVHLKVQRGASEQREIDIVAGEPTP